MPTTTSSSGSLNHGLYWFMKASKWGVSLNQPLSGLSHESQGKPLNQLLSVGGGGGGGGSMAATEGKERGDTSLILN